MKIVIRKQDKIVAYHQEPDFEEGLGIKNAILFHGGLPEDYEEKEVDEAGYAAAKAVDPVEIAAKATQANALVLANLAAIDLKSIRPLREYVLAQKDAPQTLKDHEAQVVEERKKVK